MRTRRNSGVSPDEVQEKPIEKTPNEKTPKWMAGINEKTRGRSGFK